MRITFLLIASKSALSQICQCVQAAHTLQAGDNTRVAGGLLDSSCWLTDSYTTAAGDWKRRKWAAEWELEPYGRSPTGAALQPGNPGLNNAPLLFNQLGFIKIKRSGK